MRRTRRSDPPGRLLLSVTARLRLGCAAGIIWGPGLSAPLGSPEAVLNMQSQILALIDQFTEEATQVAAELRSFKPHSDAGRYLQLRRRFEELSRWISNCKAALA